MIESTRARSTREINIPTFLIAPLIPKFELNFFSLIARNTPKIVSITMHITTIYIILLLAVAVKNLIISFIIFFLSFQESVCCE